MIKFMGLGKKVKKAENPFDWEVADRWIEKQTKEKNLRNTGKPG